MEQGGKSLADSGLPSSLYVHGTKSAGHEKRTGESVLLKPAKATSHQAI